MYAHGQIIYLWLRQWGFKLLVKVKGRAHGAEYSGQRQIFCGGVEMLLHACLLWFFVNTASCILNPYPQIKPIPIKGDPGEPLFLTPLIEAGKIKEARIAAKVGQLKGAEHVTSFSGYFTVNKAFNSNLFFWFFPVEVRNVVCVI